MPGGVDPDMIARARDALADLAPDLGYLIVGLIREAFEGDEEVDDLALLELWSNWEDFRPGPAQQTDRLPWVLDALAEHRLLIGGPDGYRIVVSNLPPALCALWSDHQARFPGFEPDRVTALAALIELGSAAADADWSSERSASRHAAAG